MSSFFSLLFFKGNSPPKQLLVSLLLTMLCCAPVHAIPLETVYTGLQPGQNGNPNSTNIIWTCSDQNLKPGIPNTPTKDTTVTPTVWAQRGDDCISNTLNTATTTITGIAETISFPFTFYGSDYTNFFIYTNGFISLGNQPQKPNQFFLSPNKNAVATTVPNNFIAPFWDDVAFNTEGGTKPITIYYQVQNTLNTVGDPTKRQLIVQWTNAEFYTSASIHPPLGTFQAILYENTNGANPTCDIRLQYRQLIGVKDRTFGSNATIGVENSTGSLGYLFFAFHSGTGDHPSKPFPLKDITLTQNESICLKWNGTNYVRKTDAQSRIYDPVYLAPVPVTPPPPIPEIIAPNLECPTTNQTFVWQPGKYQNETATGVTYTLTISSNPDFTLEVDKDGIVVPETIPKTVADFPKQYSSIPESIPKTSYTISGLNLEEGKDYYAAVIAKNTHGETWSDIKKCTATAANTSPWISTPSDISVDVGGTITAPTFTIGDNESPSPTCDTDVTVVDQATGIAPAGLFTTTLGGGAPKIAL